MSNAWRHTTKIKHLLSNKERSDEELFEVGERIAAVLQSDTEWSWWMTFDANVFTELPESTRWFSTTEALNKALTTMYDYADEHAIWIE